MGLVVRHLINVAYKAINFVLIHLRALNRFRGFCFWPLFLLFIYFFFVLESESTTIRLPWGEQTN